MKRILIIEDDQGVRAVIAAALSDAGYEVAEAADGKEGLKIYRESPTDLVITDLVMPEKDGIETIMELRSEFPRAKIIATSGGDRYANEANLRCAEMLGAKRSIAKPFKITELLEIVRELLDASRWP